MRSKDSNNDVKCQQRNIIGDADFGPPIKISVDNAVAE